MISVDIQWILILCSRNELYRSLSYYRENVELWKGEWRHYLSRGLLFHALIIQREHFGNLSMQHGDTFSTDQ